MWDKPRTDLGTIILHWLLAATLTATVATGLGIVCTGAGCGMMALWRVAPSSKAWTDHVVWAFMLAVIAVAYPIYIWRAGLVPRVVLDRIRLSDLGRCRHRWATVNVMLNWVCHVTVLAELVSGGLLVGRADSILFDIHRAGTWIILAYAPLHVLMHLAYGGFQQLLRLFRPAALAPRRPRFDQGHSGND